MNTEFTINFRNDSTSWTRLQRVVACLRAVRLVWGLTRP